MDPAVEEQAICRAHRMGQTRQVTVVRYITEKSVEEVSPQRPGNLLKTASVTDHALDYRGTAEEEEPPSQGILRCC